ncbi:MAG: hypothetical protein EKE20_18045 [Candidatus Symbiopectobacterium sp. Dall1.0]|nr:hypothetical protein [Candidatus Symbiopectobacterium sp. Dall1.0]
MIVSGTFTPGKQSGTADKDKNCWATSWTCYQDAATLYGRPFNVDVCAEVLTAKCATYYSLADGNDALILSWPPHWWCNPPFEQKIAFIRKAFTESRRGSPGMMLLPYEPATHWWHRELGTGVIVYEPAGRYNFLERDGVTKKTGANFPSALVLFPHHFIAHSIKIPFQKGIATEKGYDLI